MGSRLQMGIGVLALASCRGWRLCAPVNTLSAWMEIERCPQQARRMALPSGNALPGSVWTKALVCQWRNMIQSTWQSRTMHNAGPSYLWAPMMRHQPSTLLYM
mmetsp:Transcript_21691/g.35851  ORF Transcript_21691/g.35851 Transcript_21691/m.35851 type:complete len:103 (-) Transcript_21691:555-863(-)